MNEKKWVFLELQGAGDEGPNVGAGDHFKGAKLSSLVREMVQNSIDAEVDENKVVKVAMNLKTVKAKSFNGFYGIWDHVQACYEFQKRVSKTNRTWEERWKSMNLENKIKEIEREKIFLKFLNEKLISINQPFKDLNDFVNELNL